MKRMKNNGKCQKTMNIQKEIYSPKYLYMNQCRFIKTSKYNYTSLI